jgi:hypothetical protein
MVTVTGYNERQRKDGTTFIALEITGGAELIQSSTSGRYYATVRKCSIPSTFSKQVAESIIGQKLPGEIVKVICEPYVYENKTTGEIMQLQHSYAYQAEGAMEAVGHTRISQLELA